MLAEIYLLQLELAAEAAQKPARKKDDAFIPFSLEAFTREKSKQPQQK